MLRIPLGTSMLAKKNNFIFKSVWYEKIFGIIKSKEMCNAFSKIAEAQKPCYIWKYGCVSCRLNCTYRSESITNYSNLYNETILDIIFAMSVFLRAQTCYKIY